MSAAAKSIYVFGLYLLVVGGMLLGSPNTLLALFRMPTTTEPWIRVLGVTVMAIGMLDLASAKGEQVRFFRATVPTRLFVCAAFVALALLEIAPLTLILFGVVDAIGAAWTFTTLRRAAEPAGVTA